MNKRSLLIVLATLWLTSATSQFTLDGEFRPRTEYRNGFGTLIPDDSDPGFATSTRVRLNAGYSSETYKIFVSLQDVFVWGENRQILPNDLNNSFAVFQAWAELKLGSGWSTKIGRQILNYDDQRILGALDWAQQGRNHDAALIKYSKDNFLLDIAFAFNQDFETVGGFQSEGNTYNTTGFFSYKTMQMLYAKQKWNSLTGSLILLNNGFQNFDDNGDGDGISNLQTIGTHLIYNKGKFNAALNAFLQTGERQGELDVKGAYLLGLDLTYKAGSKVKLTAGAEIISGNDGAAGETGAFFPLYGTNHKFNGIMDYFYVGNHANSVGLIDLHLGATFDLGKNSSLMAKVLNFKGEQDLPSGESSLGTEVDLVFTKGFKGFSLKLGYSHLFPADGMYELKGVAEDVAADTQNWAWAMLILKPKFLNPDN